MHNSETFICPVCGYDSLDEPAYDEYGCSSFALCPSCGTEFGYDDSTVKHDELRKRWIKGGMKWWSTSVKAPMGWNPKEQLKKEGYSMPVSFSVHMACFPNIPSIDRYLRERHGFERRTEGFSGSALHYYQPELEMWVGMFESDSADSVDLKESQGFLSQYVVSITPPKSLPLPCLAVMCNIVTWLFNAYECDFEFAREDELILRRLKGLTWFNPKWNDDEGELALLKKLANTSTDPLIPPD